MPGIFFQVVHRQDLVRAGGQYRPAGVLIQELFGFYCALRHTQHAAGMAVLAGRIQHKQPVILRQVEDGSVPLNAPAQTERRHYDQGRNSQAEHQCNPFIHQSQPVQQRCAAGHQRRRQHRQSQRTAQYLRRIMRADFGIGRGPDLFQFHKIPRFPHDRHRGDAPGAFSYCTSCRVKSPISCTQKPLFRCRKRGFSYFSFAPSRKALPATAPSRR